MENKSWKSWKWILITLSFNISIHIAIYWKTIESTIIDIKNVDITNGDSDARARAESMKQKSLKLATLISEIRHASMEQNQEIGQLERLVALPHPPCNVTHNKAGTRKEASDLTNLD